MSTSHPGGGSGGRQPPIDIITATKRLVLSKAKEEPEPESVWTLDQSDLLRHCIKQDAADIWESFMRNQSVEDMMLHQKRDASRFVIGPSGIPNAGNGLFALSRIESGERMGFQTCEYANDAKLVMLPYSPVTDESVKKLIQEYEQVTNKKTHVAVVMEQDNKRWSMVAKFHKDVKTGDEVFQKYGFQQWLLNALGNTEYVHSQLSRDEIQILEKHLITYIGTDKTRAFTVFLHVANSAMKLVAERLTMIHHRK